MNSEMSFNTSTRTLAPVPTRTALFSAFFIGFESTTMAIQEESLH